MSWIIGGVVVLFIIGFLVRNEEKESHPTESKPSIQSSSVIEKAKYGVETTEIGFKKVKESVRTIPKKIEELEKNTRIWHEKNNAIREATNEIDTFLAIEKRLLELNLQASSRLFRLDQDPRAREIYDELIEEAGLNNQSVDTELKKHLDPHIEGNLFQLPQHEKENEFYPAILEKLKDLSKQRLDYISNTDRKLFTAKEREYFIDALTNNNLEYLRPIFERPSGKKISDFSQFFEVIES